MKSRFIRSAAILGLLGSLLFSSPMTALAYTEEYADPGGGEAVTIEEHNTETEKSTESVPEEEAELTPDGNMDLVDDLSETQSETLQFMTVQTRDGSTFYIVIERSRNSENVHFLNQVDARDLMAIMDEEEVAALVPEEEKEEEVVTPTPTPEPEVTTIEVEEPEPEKRNGSGLGALLIFVLLGGGIAAGYYFLKVKPGREKYNPEIEREFEDDEGYIDEDEENEDLEFVSADEFPDREEEEDA